MTNRREADIDVAAHRSLPVSTALIADRLAVVRRERFVGRAAELALFRSALEVPDGAAADFTVVYLHGPGGVGKTTLLQQFAGLARDAGRVVLPVDARNLHPTPDDLLAALAQALDVEPAPADRLAAQWPDDSVLVIDSYEPSTELDGWLRDVLLPRLPARTLVLLAGRQVPTPQWRTDLAWGSLTRVVALRNLEPDESRRFLEMRGVAETRRDDILAAVHGHPLALSLAADTARADVPLASGFDLIDQPAMVRMLLRRLVDEVPGPQHRVALHACATARVLPESMLAAALGLDVDVPDEAARAHALFEWLGGLSCMEMSPQGLSPHDLAREVLYADARRCDFAARRLLNGRLLACLYERFQRAEGAQRQRLWFDIIYVQRNNPGLRPYFAWSAAGTTLADPLRNGDDLEAIRAMTRRHEGEASAAIAAHWLRRQPDAFLAFRDLHGRLVGFLANLRLDAATGEDRRIDPATDRALSFVEMRAPARGGEEIGHFRFWMASDDHQSNPATMNVLAANASLNWTTHPRLAWSLCAVVDTDHFEPMFRAIGMQREPDADFVLGSRRWGVFAHDWRAESVAQWLMRKVDRASQDEPTTAPIRGAVPLLVLSESDFAEAVRRALRDFACPDALAANPLLRTRLLAQRSRSGEGDLAVEALRDLLRQAAAALAAPKDRKSLAAIRHTYLEPAATQEQAAEAMGVPFNTYRYQLARGTRRIARWVWARELDSA